MGSSKDVMELFAERDIRQNFPTHDGWKIEPVQAPAASGRFFRVFRKKWVGEEVVFVAVSFDRTPADEIFNALDTLPNGMGAKTKKYLLTPQAADRSAVPPHVRPLLMNAFAFSEGKLVWLTKKKNARKYPCTQPVAA